MEKTRKNNLVALVIIPMIILTACGGSGRAKCEPSGDGSATVIPTPKPQSPDEIRTSWQSGPHAQSRILSAEGQNGDCAQCHDRLNWIPDQTLSSTIGSNSALSPETNAKSAEGEVSCEICHEGDTREGGIAWLADPRMQIYEEVTRPTQLCLKCHLENGYEGHPGISVMGPHMDLECVKCHNSHDTSSSCTDSGCHSPFAQECEPVQTHDKPHQEVTCSGCHDATGMKIAWNEVRSAWDTFADVSEDAVARSVTSHHLSLEVDCNRCHEPGNHPWGY